MATQTSRPQNGTKNSGQKQERQAPVHTVKIGKLRASIWQNSSDNGPFYSVTLSRIYRESGQNGQWKSATSFGRDDLLAVGEICRQAYLWVIEKMQAERNGHSSEPAPSQDNEDPPY